MNVRRIACVAGLGALLALGAGCGSSDDDDKGAAAASGSPSATAPAKPKGKRIVVGLMVATNNNIQSVPEEISTARAAAQYVNDELGGIHGRAIDLRVCETRNTAESAAGCANRLVRQRPVAVVGGGDVGMEAAMPIFESARVPVIGGAFFYPKETLGPPPIYRSLMSGYGLSLGPAIASYAVKTFKAKKVVVVSQEGTKVVVDPYLNVPMRNLGAQPVGFVGAPVTASDLTPYFQAAASKDPDVVAVFGLPCVPSLQAFRGSGSDAKLLQPAQCADSETLDQVGDLAEGSYYIYGQTVPELNPDNPDVKAFVAAVEKYAPKEKRASSDFGTGAFQGVMNVADLARKLPADRITSQGMQRLVRSTKRQKNWLGLSGSYHCDPLPIPDYPGVCSSEAQLAQLEDGKLQLAQPGHIDLAPLLR